MVYVSLDERSQLWWVDIHGLIMGMSFGLYWRPIRDYLSTCSLHPINKRISNGLDTFSIH
jgi:hypothetical protein